MTKKAKAARKFREDKKEIIKRIEALRIDVEESTSPADLACLMAIREMICGGISSRNDNLSAKLGGAVMDYVHSR